MELTPQWASIAGKFKDLTTSSFKTKGDLGALVKQYDAVRKKFDAKTKELRDTRTSFRNSNEKALALGDELYAVEKQSEDVAARRQRAGATASAKDLEALTSLIKERRVLCDKILALDQKYGAVIKAMTDGAQTVSKVQEGFGVAVKALKLVEDQVRKAVSAYVVIAKGMNRTDIADAVQGIGDALEKARVMP